MATTEPVAGLLRARSALIVAAALGMTSLAASAAGAAPPIDDRQPPVVGPLGVSRAGSSAAAGLDLVQLRWPAATDGPGSGIARFEVALGEVSGAPVLWQTVTFTPGSEMGATIEVPSDGDAVLRVRALDRAGNLGPWSAEVDAVVDGAARRDPLAATSETVLIAGDIASCDGNGDSSTARLIEENNGLVMTAGDNAYPLGTSAQFRDCYGPTWGRFLDRTRPAPGNHDWATPGASGYFGYFGKRAGPKGRGYYAFDLGEWRIYVLASDLCFRGAGEARDDSSCGPGTDQARWLRADLAARPRDCVMAVWHHPRFSSGPHGNSSKPFPLLKLLYDAGAELVINGHDHVYERFGRARPDGTPDAESGIQQIIVGTGGAGLYGLRSRTAPNSEVRSSSTYGVLCLRLEPGSYGWRFLPVAGGSFTDRGSGACHGAPPGR